MMTDHQKSLMRQQFRVVVVKGLKKEFPDDFYLIERDLENWLDSHTLLQIRQTARETIFIKKKIAKDIQSKAS